MSISRSSDLDVLLNKESEIAHAPIAIAPKTANGKMVIKSISAKNKLLTIAPVFQRFPAITG
jgi:hypothetical protein